MPTALELLDEAMNLGRQELRMLGEGEVDKAEILAHERGRLLEAAWEGRDEVDSKAMRRSLQRCEAQHSKIVKEARRQHGQLRERLQRTRGERKRFAGYGAQRQPDPNKARFISRQG